ncbi:24402_t:CDS:2, partial [Gigaspora rosea]
MAWEFAQEIFILQRYLCTRLRKMAYTEGTPIPGYLANLRQQESYTPPECTAASMEYSDCINGLDPNIVAVY